MDYKKLKKNIRFNINTLLKQNYNNLHLYKFLKKKKNLKINKILIFNTIKNIYLQKNMKKKLNNNFLKLKYYYYLYNKFYKKSKKKAITKILKMAKVNHTKAWKHKKNIRYKKFKFYKIMHTKKRYKIFTVASFTNNYSNIITKRLYSNKFLLSKYCQKRWRSILNKGPQKKRVSKKKK